MIFHACLLSQQCLEQTSLQVKLLFSYHSTLSCHSPVIKTVQRTLTYMFLKICLKSCLLGQCSCYPGEMPVMKKSPCCWLVNKEYYTSRLHALNCEHSTGLRKELFFCIWFICQGRLNARPSPPADQMESVTVYSSWLCSRVESLSRTFHYISRNRTELSFSLSCNLGHSDQSQTSLFFFFFLAMFVITLAADTHK